MGGTKDQRRTLAAAAALGLVLLWVVPLFLRQPLTLDTVYYDICGRMLLHGRVLYRDIFDTNFPGVIWIHAALRATGSTSPVVVRVFDLAVVAAVIVLLLGWTARAGRSRPALLVAATLLVLFYTSRTEWSHCQRDTWMLLPALAALHLRWSQVLRLGAADPRHGRVLGAGALEGVLWGAAVWLKPFVVIPALAAWLTSLWLTRGAPLSGRTRWSRVALDLAGLLTGGLAVGLVGVLWLRGTGAWEPFWDVMLRWNQDYYAPVTWTVRQRRWAETLTRFLPWSLALPAAWIVSVLRLVRTPAASPDNPDGCNPGGCNPGGCRSQALLGAFLLGWSFQALVVQRPFDYILTPPVLVALALLAGEPVPPRMRTIAAAGLAGLIVWALAVHPMLSPARLTQWARCWRPGRDPSLLQALCVEADHVGWRSLARVEDYLRGQVRDGDLLCFDASTIPLYWDLQVLPPTRFVYTANTLSIYEKRRDAIQKELDAGPQRLVVTDLAGMSFSPPELAALPPEGEQPAPLPSLAWKAARPPWSLPVVFRAGRYVVHRADGRPTNPAPPTP